MPQNPQVLRALVRLGRNIQLARRRRRLPMSIVAERAGISVKTLASVERGEPGVSIGNVSAVIYAIGMGTPFADILDPKNDSLAFVIDEQHLPKRIRLRKDSGT